MARVLIASLLAAAAASPLLAQPVAPPAPLVRVAPMAATMTRADVTARVQKQFAKRDANRDGVLTTDEMQARRGQREGAMRRQRGPGVAQAMRDPNLAFNRMDANRDGMISRDEFARGRQVRVERVVINRGGQPGQPGMRAMRRGGGGGMLGAALLRMADQNRDGRVTLAEANGAALRHFDMMDSNRDGRITPQERAAGRIHMRQMRSAG